MVEVTREGMGGFPAVYLTAYYAAMELAHANSSHTVLIHSAGGGVGLALVQLCSRVAKCRVVGVVGSPHKRQQVEANGAAHVILKGKDMWKQAEELAPEGYDVVFDANGAATFKDSYAHVACGGKLVVYGFHSMLTKSTSTDWGWCGLGWLLGGGGRPNWFKLAWDWLWTPSFSPMHMTTDNKSVMAFNLSYMFHKKEFFAEVMDKLMKWLDEGLIDTLPTTTFGLEDVVNAHKALESGTTVGKMVLIPEDE